MRRPALPALLSILLAAAAPAAVQPRYGMELEGFDYGYPVVRFGFSSQGQPLEMAFIDVTPPRPNGRTAVLLHGKNFCAGTWAATIRALADRGYRVIAPDQIGFCKSSKPAGYQFSLAQLAHNTHALLAARGVRDPVVIGHSMGGMLATRYALMFPQEVSRLVLVDPIGLEDWQAKGVPYATVDQLLAGERKTDFASIKAYQQKYYYAGRWDPRFDQWVAMLAGMYAGPGRERVALDQAQTSEMIFTQPVVHELGRLEPPVTLMIGTEDRTAPGANRAPAALAATLGNYPALARAAVAAIPHARLVEFQGLGHAPQIEAPDRFHQALIDALTGP